MRVIYCGCGDDLDAIDLVEILTGGNGLPGGTGNLVRSADEVEHDGKGEAKEPEAQGAAHDW
jgi:hypothetical protein